MAMSAAISNPTLYTSDTRGVVKVHYYMSEFFLWNHSCQMSYGFTDGIFDNNEHLTTEIRVLYYWFWGLYAVVHLHEAKKCLEKTIDIVTIKTTCFQ